MFPNQFYNGMGFGSFPGYNAYSQIPMQTMRNAGLLARLRNGINWSGLLDNTSKTLNVVNQAIPVVNQVKPLFNNMKTVFRIANIMKDEPEKNKNSTISSEPQKKEVVSSNQPTFFL